MNFLPVPEVKYQQKSTILGEFQVSVHASLMNARISEALSSVQKRVAIPGFRPGKAPLDLVKKKYREDVLQDVFKNIVSETYRKGATDHKVPVAGEPYITKTNFHEWKEGENLEYTAEVDLIPQVDLKKYKGLPITKREGSIKEEDIEIVLKNLLDPKAELLNLDPSTKLQKGHLAVIDFEGSLNGTVLPDATAKNFFLEVGANNSLEEFQAGVLGMKAGEEKTIEVPYPADYKNPAVSGKTLNYSVKLHEIKQKKYPELNDELAKEFQAENAADLKARVRKSLEEELAAEQEQKTMEELILAFLEANPCEVPPSLVNRQLQYIYRDVAETLKRQRYDEKVIEEYFRKHIKDFTGRAEREVKLAFLVPKVVEAEKLTATEEDFQERFQEIVKNSDQRIEAIEKFYKDSKKHHDDLANELVRTKALKLLLANAKIK